jgi:hypothetical protein
MRESSEAADGGYVEPDQAIFRGREILKEKRPREDEWEEERRKSEAEKEDGWRGREMLCLRGAVASRSHCPSTVLPLQHTVY